MLVQVGKDIELATFLTRNNRPQTGKSVTVRAIDISDGSELLASTPLVERSPALYAFLWDSPPQAETEVDVEFKWKNFIHSERISIITSLGGGAGVSENIEGFIESGEELVGEVLTEPTSLVGELENGIELSGELLDQDTLEGELEDSEASLEGEIICQ